MFKILSLVFIVSAILNGGLGLEITPCNKRDIECVKNLVSTVYLMAVPGNSDLGMDSLDPLNMENLEGDVPGVKYTLTNSKIYGFKDCDITGTRLSKDEKELTVNMLCPKIILKGKYATNGKLLDKALSGSGDYNVDAKNYKMAIKYKPSELSDENGKKHLSLEYVDSTATPEDIKIDLQNLFDGNKELAEPIIKFINDNVITVAELLQKPIIDRSFTTLIKNVNKLLKNFSLNDIVIE